MSIKSFIRNHIWKTSEPWADIAYDGKKLVVKDYNKAFVDNQRSTLGGLCDGKSDAEVVSLFSDRENLDREEPKLEILHLGIETDGRIKMKLDWNRAFIKLLNDHGINGETEDETIQTYLQMMTANELQGNVDPEEFFSKEQIDAAFEQMDRELDSEFDDAKKQVLAKKPRRRTFK